MGTFHVDELKVYTKSYKIEYSDINQFGELTFPKLFNHLGDIAFNHADAISSKYNAKSKFSYAVVWTKMRVSMTYIPRWNDIIFVSTWISPLQSNQRDAFRNFKILDSSKKMIGFGYGKLLFFDLKQRIAIPIPTDLLSYPTHSEILDNHRFSQLDLITHTAKETRQMVKFQDLDIYKHASNVSYLKWVINHLDAEFLTNYHLRSAEIHFLKELRLDDQFRILSHEQPLLENHSLPIQYEIRDISSEKLFSNILTTWSKRITI